MTSYLPGQNRARRWRALKCDSAGLYVASYPGNQPNDFAEVTES
jgi:hypothetical protein